MTIMSSLSGLEKTSKKFNRIQVLMLLWLYFYTLCFKSSSGKLPLLFAQGRAWIVSFSQCFCSSLHTIHHIVALSPSSHFSFNDRLLLFVIPQYFWEAELFGCQDLRGRVSLYSPQQQNSDMCQQFILNCNFPSCRSSKTLMS